MTEKEILEEIREKYGSVSKMMTIVENEISRLRKYGGHNGRDGADTLRQALYLIPAKYHKIYYKWMATYPRP